MSNIGIILAAGRGSRMKSSKPKALQPLAGRALISHLILEAQKVYSSLRVVIAPDMSDLKLALEGMSKELSVPLDIKIQHTARGTGDAALSGLEGLSGDDSVSFLYADNPLLTEATMKRLSQKLLDSKSSLALVAMRAPENKSYGRVILKNSNYVDRIVEYKEASEEEKLLDLCNGGVISGKADEIKTWLEELVRDQKDSSKEIYLTDIIEKASAKFSVSFIEAAEDELIGINSRVDLAKAEDIFQERQRLKAMEAGVHLRGAQTIFLSPDVEFGKDVLIEPHVVIEGAVKIKDGAHIKSFSHLADCTIGENSVVGPYARIRPGTICESNVRIGNFVEIKNSRLKDGVKVSHLSYLGDSAIGDNSNIGGGTITCNYDGFTKHQTEIGKNTFIGSHTTLVAPVEVGDGSLIAAGSVITQSIPKDGLAFGRARQETKEEGAKRWREIQQSKK